MTDHTEITEAMITAAMATGKASGALAPNARPADVRRIVAAAVSAMTTEGRRARYDLIVNTTIDSKKARFLSATPQRCYYRVECEDGQILVVHGNDIRPDGRVR
jgi:hypothetical protein